METAFTHDFSTSLNFVVVCALWNQVGNVEQMAINQSGVECLGLAQVFMFRIGNLESCAVAADNGYAHIVGLVTTCWRCLIVVADMAARRSLVVLQQQETSCLQVFQIDSKVHVHGVTFDKCQLFGLCHCLSVDGSMCPSVLAQVTGNASSIPRKWGSVHLLVPQVRGRNGKFGDVLLSLHHAGLTCMYSAYGIYRGLSAKDASNGIELNLLAAVEFEG